MWPGPMFLRILGTNQKTMVKSDSRFSTSGIWWEHKCVDDQLDLACRLDLLHPARSSNFFSDLKLQPIMLKYRHESGRIWERGEYSISGNCGRDSCYARSRSRYEK